MSSFVRQPECPLCHSPVDPLGPHFRATGDFLPPGDPAAGIADAPLHWSCYADWEDRPRFARLYVAAWVKANRKNPFWWSVHRDEDLYIAINPQKPVEEASIRLCDVGSDIRVSLPRWTEWLREPAAVTPNLSPLERTSLERVRPRLAERFPTDHALVDALDPSEKRPRRGEGA